MSNDIKSVLSKLKAEDVVVDKLGRLIISNQEVADAIRKIGVSGTVSSPLDDNYGCCKNGVACGKVNISDLTDII